MDLIFMVEWPNSPYEKRLSATAGETPADPQSPDTCLVYKRNEAELFTQALE